MADYSLNVGFTNDQLQVLYATGTNVVVAKPSGSGNPNVAWQVFKPLMANQLSWDEQYGLYASTSSVTNGATLSQMSNVPVGAAMNKLYTLQDSGVISGPASGGQPNAFSLLNTYSSKDYMTVGLYQNANVNGVDILGNAISAVPVLKMSTAVMTPYTTVYIWLQSQVKSNSVVTTVTSPMTQLNYGGGINSISVAYDSDSGKFLPTGNFSMSAQRPDIAYIEAAL
ncbi:hypothetical protein SAMN05444266_10820 [Chitinophaga jiangningensis]|uniref:Uncharacterized protein n=1 Tax=Chitinophaga jiangningensis TaxID=1419482 RepID=A0A1M7IM22_9BACT|nr:hypothetical protein [Chitinophaga jiangningensis]SHM41780.1 hypothetical protein SAMN05444266_10820 [Chitinophaga jiangningensis]